MKTRTKAEILLDLNVIDAKISTLDFYNNGNPIDHIRANALFDKEDALFAELKALTTRNKSLIEELTNLQNNINTTSP